MDNKKILEGYEKPTIEVEKLEKVYSDQGGVPNWQRSTHNDKNNGNSNRDGHKNN